MKQLQTFRGTMHSVAYFLCLSSWLCFAKSGGDHLTSKLRSEEDFVEESGDWFNCRVNWTNLDSLIQNTVDRRLKDFKLHLASLDNERVSESQSGHMKRHHHHFHELRKEKLKSFEFRMLRLSKDLEHTKLIVSKQTEALERSVLLSLSHETKAKDISSRHTKLENAVTSLTDRVGKLMNLLKTKHGASVGNLTSVVKSSKANGAQVITYPKGEHSG